MLATHLDTAEADRILAVKRLKVILQERPADWPMRIAGDMNAAPGLTVINSLTEDWTAASLGETSFTFPSKKPTRQIDFILFRPASRWKVVETSVLEESVASGHRPILAVLELQSEPARSAPLSPA